MMNKMLLAAMLVNVGIDALQAAHMSDAELKEAYKLHRDAANRMLLRAASGESDITFIERALKQGADINAKNEAGNSALNIAVRANKGQIVSRLLDTPGIDLDIKDTEGNSALVWAVSAHDGSLVLQLLSAGADINAQNGNGITALMVAAMDGDADMINMLLNHGANVTLEDNKGKTAAGHVDILSADDEATRERKTALKKMLQERIFEARKKKLEEKLPGMQGKKEKARKLLEEHSRSKVRELKKVLPDEVAVTIEEEYVGQPKPERAMREVERREQARKQAKQKFEEEALKESQAQ